MISVSPKIKGIISLTSWKARINTVGLTIFSLLVHCPHWKIVLTLSDEEFTKKENELPKDLICLMQKGLLEILWCHKNYKSCKKVIFAMMAFPNLPIVSADDDCIYVRNYADEMYDLWRNNQSCPISYRKSINTYGLCGPASLYPPSIYQKFIKYFIQHYEQNGQDDDISCQFLRSINLKPLSCSDKFPCFFHDEIDPLNGSMNVPRWFHAQQFYKE